MTAGILLSDLKTVTVSSKKKKKESGLLLREGAAFAAGKAWNRNQEGCSDWPDCILGDAVYGKEDCRQKVPENKRLILGHREM